MRSPIPIPVPALLFLVFSHVGDQLIDCLLDDLSEELRLTAVMEATEDDPVTHKANNQSLDIQRERGREKEYLKQELGLENAQDDYIEALILHRMWYYHKCCKTEKDDTMCLKALTYNKDKIDMLKDNIQIRVIEFGWEEFKTQL